MVFKNRFNELEKKRFGRLLIETDVILWPYIKKDINIKESIKDRIMTDILYFKGKFDKKHKMFKDLLYIISEYNISNEEIYEFIHEIRNFDKKNK